MNNGRIDTDEYGECVQLWCAELYLKSQKLQFTNERGALIFQYPDQEKRSILPVFINGAGWFYPMIELRRNYVKPAPEVMNG